MESRPKPWKVEYAKSSRATCKTCKKSIVRGDLRIAKLVHSRQFEGLMPMWNHAECILKQRGQFHTVDDVEGVDALRYEDQEKIIKYLNDLTGGFATNIYASPTIDGLDESSIEKSKSSRATCKSCNQKIIKGQVRISTTSDPDNPWVRGTLPVWRHAKCFLEMGWWTNAMEKMSGWDSLTSEDKQAVQSIAKPYIQDAKLEPKQKAGQPLERPCQSSNISEGRKIIDEASVEGKGEKRKPEESETLPVKSENIGASLNNRTRKLDGHVGEGSVPKAAKLEKQVEDQTKVTWTIKDGIQKRENSGVISVILEATFQQSR